MSPPTLRNPNSSSSWGLKRCLKIAAVFVALSQVSVAQAACRPSTVKVVYEITYDKICVGKACSEDRRLVGWMKLTIRNTYDKSFTYALNNGQTKLKDVGKHCHDDGQFCVDFNGPMDATLYYANKRFNLGSPSVETGVSTFGSSEYWTCL
ncbi:hypothetical protein F5H01DRAFT_348828 [Linnemannia elongata]|nr:hypothetical protein F5H01DRAFT_348828 [Linnemannia elongata]